MSENLDAAEDSTSLLPVNCGAIVSRTKLIIKLMLIFVKSTNFM